MDSTAQCNYFPSLPRSILADVMILSEEFTADQILVFIEKSEESLIVLHHNNSTMISASRLQLGILCALAISLRTPSVRIMELWEEVLWEITDLATDWEFENNINIWALESTPLKPWILTIFTDLELCPNPYLRLKMINFFSFWPKIFLLDAVSGMQAVAGLVINCKYIDLDHLVSDDQDVTLFTSLIHMLISLKEYGHLANLAAAALDQIRGIKVGGEASLLYHLMQVLKQLAEAILEEYKLDEDIEDVLFLFKYLLDLLKLLLAPPFNEAYGGPGLAKVASDTLVTITVSIVTIGSTLQDKAGSGYKKLLSKLNFIYETISIFEEFRSIFQVLRLDHAQFLSSLSKKAADSGSFFQHFIIPCQESSEEVPEEFRDSVTLSLMEAPVLLHSSKMVIDESTLVRLLLESPLDPFTRSPLDHGSYSRLPELQVDILAWKNNTQITE